MAVWRKPSNEIKPVIASFGDGENNGMPVFQIKDSELTYSRNMDSREYPAIITRPPRSTYGTVMTTDINGLGQSNNSLLHSVTSNTWQYWGSSTNSWLPLTTALSNSPAKIGEFVTGTNRYSFLMNSTQKLLCEVGVSTSVVLSDTNCPFTDMFAVHKNRIYALKNAQLSYSALSKTTDWTTASDAGSIIISRAKGQGTGIAEYNDHVIAFTEHSMHELYGTGPSNYELIDVEGAVGCISHRSIIKCNKKLYWLDYDGVYEYGGATPIKISDAVEDYIKNINFTYKTKCVSGSQNDFLYLSIPYGSGATGNNLILKFDTKRRVWFVESGNFTDFVTIGQFLYGVDTAGQVWKMRDESATAGLDSTTSISWEFITKPYNENSIEGQKTVSNLWVVAETTSLSVGYSTNVYNNDSTTFTSLTSLTASSNVQNQRVQVPVSSLQNTNWYRLRFNGSGQSLIHYLQKNVRVKVR